MKVVFLQEADVDLQDLRQYIVRNFGKAEWARTRRRISESVRTIRAFPQGGRIPDEIAAMGVGQYRQAVSGMNRLIYEVRGDLVYIHIVCDARRDMRTLMLRRLVRVSAVNDPRLPYWRGAAGTARPAAG